MNRSIVSLSPSRWEDFRVIVYTLAGVIVVSLALVIAYKGFGNLSAVLWAVACLIVGGLIGFLFGIPRVLQGTNPPPIDGKSDPTDYRQQVNTNLEQISDWLTKIIVGVGLVELRTLPDRIQRMAQFIASGIGGTQADEVFASALIIYFSIIGFLGGYLVTRIYLAGAFTRADLESQNTVKFAGQTLTIAQVSKEFSAQIDDVRSQILQLSQQPQQRSVPEAKGDIGEITPYSSDNRAILWVDDDPKANSILIDQLTRRGFEVVTSSSASDAINKAKSGRFGRIICDMSNVAGIPLIKAIREHDAHVPIVVYATPNDVDRYRSEALTAGATDITASQTELYRALQIQL